MSEYPPEVKDYVEEIIYAYIDSMRKSQQIEDRYNELPSQVKRATTRQLREYAKRTADYILDNTNGIEELSNVESDAFIRDAITSALDDD